MSIGVLWAGMRVATWITHAGGKFRHGLLEKSMKIALKIVWKNLNNCICIALEITFY